MVPALAFRAAKRLLGPLIWRQTYRCLTLPWDQARALAAQASGPARDAEVRLLEREELRRYSRENEYEISASFVDSIAGRDDLCFGTFVEGRLAAYRFFALRPTAIDAHLRFDFPPRWIYAYKALTLPAWRGNRLHRELFVRSLPEVGRWLGGLEPPLGFVTLVMSDNRSSAAALGRLGFRPVDSFSVLRVRTRPRVIAPSRQEPEGFRIEVLR
jgi:hypothetical protein